MDFFNKFEIDAEGIKYEKPLPVTAGVGGALETPYYLHVATDTDLAVLVPSAAGVLVALLVGVVTMLFQFRQIRANITSFRHQWMVELRSSAAEYLQILYSTALCLTEKEGYALTDAYIEKQEKIAILTFKIELLLSRDDDATKSIFKLDKELCSKLYSLTYKASWSEFFQDFYKLRDLFRVELEDAWLDVQVDLSTKKRNAGKGDIFRRLSPLIVRSPTPKDLSTEPKQD
ncbi:hypothetical protein [Pseudomonas sp. BC42]|uniref:hypothetical protein n=1 Tax=Pseudomonas sp. BC42 TaxID=2933816 RepID=UPI001F35B132|nr:hypothetical protein [Pseudomonas sp. BC42]ULT72988.1 hypothetical protein L1O02_11680 [Pseudomonas sp. BC42]